MKTYRFFFQPGFSRVQKYPVKKEKADKNSLLKGKSRQVYPVKKTRQATGTGKRSGCSVEFVQRGNGVCNSGAGKKNGTGEKMFGSSCGATVESNNYVNARSSLK